MDGFDGFDSDSHSVSIFSPSSSFSLLLFTSILRLFFSDRVYGRDRDLPSCLRVRKGEVEEEVIVVEEKERGIETSTSRSVVAKEGKSERTRRR